MSKRISLQIWLAMLAGIIAGVAIRHGTDAATGAQVVSYLSILTDLFLKLIKMIIAPLVLATLFGGIANMGGGPAALGRLGAMTMGWFLLASIVSLVLGLLFVNLLQPGAGLELTPPSAGPHATAHAATHPTLKSFVLDLVPASIFDALARNTILPIVVFATLSGVVAASMGDRAGPLAKGAETITALMLGMTDQVMRLAPLAVFAAITSAVASEGLSILVTFGRFLGSFYLALLVLWALLFAAAFVALGNRATALFRAMREPFLIGFTTASSEAAFPRILEGLERFGVPRRIGGFVLPLGYSFNLDGSMVYCSFAMLFIAQAYGVALGPWQQFTMLLLLMVTSKGIAGLPRASLVVVAATLPLFSLPEGGLVLVLAVDQFFDMGRTATNVIGNAVAAALVAKWDGVLETPGAPAPDTSAAIAGPSPSLTA